MSAKYNQIVDLLDKMTAEYEVLEHSPVMTSRQAEEVTGHSSEIGAKSIVFKTGDKFLLVVVRGSDMADFNKIRAHSGSRRARLATPDEVYEVMGVKIGACYPFGVIAGVEMLVDNRLSQNRHISFSPGVHDKHILMPWTEYNRVVQPKLINIIR